MFGGQPLYSGPSRFPLRLCDDRMYIVLFDDNFSNSVTEGSCLMFVLCPFCRTLNGFFTVTLTSDKLLSTLVIGGSRSWIAFNRSMFYIYFTTGFAITSVVERSARGHHLFTLFVYKAENRTSVRLGAP